ncbi:MAG: tetratricopeptide repeat protein [Maricaulaceae bacterium]|jgi:Flp pilus assembly protein TadD
MRIPRSLLLAASTLSATACATAPPPTDDEQALIDSVTSRTIVPASAEAREAMAGADLVTRAAFWANEYENNPADAEAAMQYAKVSRSMGRPSQSVAIANQALALHPDDVALLNELGAALILDRRAEAAVRPLERAVSLAPENARAHNLLGAALDHMEEHERARSHYEAALEIRGEDPTTLTNYAMSYALSGDPATAEDLLRRALELPGASAQVRQNLSLALSLQGKFDEAERLAQQDLPREVAESNIQYVRDMIDRPRRWDGLRGTVD